VLVVGAGFSGAVLARELAEAGVEVCVVEQRDHVAGHCHTARDADTGVMAHVHGPHIFHTSDDGVWNYLQRFGEWMPFVNRVKASTPRGVFGLPINLHTINQFFGTAMDPGAARRFIAALGDAGIDEPANLEEQALKFVGRELYDAFFRGYTIKQWGCDPRELPAEVLKRLPVRFDYNDNYYDSSHQALPRHGYTRVVENLLDHARIRIVLRTAWAPSMCKGFDHVFHSGALDACFDFCDGRLGYRTMHWQWERHDGDFQGTAIINYPALDTPWTRVIEHRHLAPWECHAKSLVAREFSRETDAADMPFYPKRLAADRALLGRYVARAKSLAATTFIGRLGTYRYLDMDQAIADALALARQWRDARARNAPLPVFSRPPL
jgi:UDP-galactopyranose mutase